MLTLLSGGTGGRKLFEGIINVLPQKEVSVICNTGDDIEIYGLHISPDVDSILYAAAGIFDEERGWGIKDDTFNFHNMITKIVPTYSWFNLGDKDLAIHVVRTNLLKSGMKLSQVTNFLANKFNVDCNIIPMSDDSVTTYIFDGINKKHFQEFWVLFRGEMPVKSVIFEGIEKAQPCEKAIDAVLSSKLIIIGPSNPITSIGPILSLTKLKETIADSKALKVAVSPIKGNNPYSGPAATLMKSLGLEVSSLQVAKLYQDIIDFFVIDENDDDSEIKKLGIEVIKTNIDMKTKEDKVRLAKTIIDKLYL
jgi:LPPG:Fo 2-phospho-L-lactate transferase